MEYVNILGVKINKMSMKEAVEKAAALLNTEGLSTIYTPNSEIILYASENSEFTDVINSADMVVPDGIGVVYGSKILGIPSRNGLQGLTLYVTSLKLW